MGGHKSVSTSFYEVPVYIPAPVWVSPTSHSDPSDMWSEPTNAYDNDLDTYSLAECPSHFWTAELFLLIQPAIRCSKVRFFGRNYYNPDVNVVHISVRYAGEWHVVYEGPFTKGIWSEHDVTGMPDGVDAALIRFYNSSAEADYLVYLNEFQFLKVL